MTSSTSRRDPRAVAAPFGPLSTVRYTVDGVDFDMVRVPPGRFVDGEGETRREMLVSRPFELGVAPVTQALWWAVMGSSPSGFRGKGRPVENVSWSDAQQLMVGLERLGLQGFRLPTEAEWVWSARCGVSTWWAGAERAKAVAVIGARQTGLVSELCSGSSGTFDQSGNVWEWVADWYQGSSVPGIDLRGPASGSIRVIRGGCWNFVSQYARVASRNFIPPGRRNRDLGFRLLRAPLDP